MNDEQLTALIDQRVAERTRELEDQLAKVTKNRDSILREKRELEARDQRSRDRAETDRLLKAADRILAPSKPDLGQPADRVIIPRGVSPAEYQRLKAAAIERGVPYVVGGEHADAALARNARGESSRVKFVEDERTFWANQAMQRQVGIVELSRRAAVAGKRLRIFRSAEELEPEARAKHDRILQEGDADSLVFEP